VNYLGRRVVDTLVDRLRATRRGFVVGCFPQARCNGFYEYEVDSLKIRKVSALESTSSSPYRSEYSAHVWRTRRCLEEGVVMKLLDAYRRSEGKLELLNDETRLRLDVISPQKLLTNSFIHYLFST
jgi:hypothetical protein